MSKLNLMILKTKIFADGVKEKARNKISEVKDTLNEGVQGAFAFEYIIVLVVMVAIIFAAWGILGDAIRDKAQEIADWMEGASIDPSARPTQRP